MMVTPPKLAQRAIQEARQGNLEQALVLARQALAGQPSDPGLLFFVGMLHSRREQLREAAACFRSVLQIVPGDSVARLELIRVLVGLNELDEAEMQSASIAVRGPEHDRLRAMIFMRRDRPADAAAIYRSIVAADRRDFESWGNLGVCRLMSGDVAGAVKALETSLQLRRNQQRFRDKWSEAQLEAGTGEEALERARRFAAEHPRDVLVQVTIARLEDLLGRPDQGIEALEQALAFDPAHPPALVALADLYERSNRLDECAETIARIEAGATIPPELFLLKAQLAFRQGELGTALDLATAAPKTFTAGARAQLLGKIHDRLGNADEAFDAFEEMNHDNAMTPAVVAARSKSFRDALKDRRDTVTRAWVRSWPRSRRETAPKNPIFLVGFPRSGTTLLDTLMMGHPGLCVAEEKPMLNAVAKVVGNYRSLGSLDERQLRQLRELYFAEAARFVPDLGARTLVDKQPFAMTDAPLIHRLFPHARFVFAQRHPCDVVLSCFITRFEPNDALLNFTTLKGAACLYDKMMGFWSHCRAVLPLIVHAVRYERLVEDPAAELEALMTFLGLEWDERVLDSPLQANERGFINTPSYAQVAEPLYDRSVNRWKRYRKQMQPVVPLLGTWTNAMGYDT